MGGTSDSLATGLTVIVGIGSIILLGKSPPPLHPGLCGSAPLHSAAACMVCKSGFCSVRSRAFIYCCKWSLFAVGHNEGIYALGAGVIGLTQ